MKTQVFAFAQVTDPKDRAKVYEEILNGKSRFGMWEQKKSLKEEWYGKNMSLLKIKKDDWIVHVNMPTYGKCVVVKVREPYAFDGGLFLEHRPEDCKVDFNNVFEVDKTSVIEFYRNNPNVLPSVNLAPRRRIQRVLQVNDFLESMENLKKHTYDSVTKTDRSIVHLKAKVDKILPQITKEINRMNRSKDFELFLDKVFNNILNTTSLKNGFGWRSDNGADLIIEIENPLYGTNLNFSNKVVVQAKSYSGEHFDKHAIDQIVNGINYYKADAGLLITTANSTDELEEYIIQKSEEIEKTIDVISGIDVSKFVLKHAPELIL